MLLVEQLERQVLAFIAAGRWSADDVPHLAVHRRRFDEALAAEPPTLTVVDQEQLELRRALGVA